ncbi:Fc.00g011220.m01.CDS01 [Cosmosporella sp. VM-42]
MTPGYRKLAPMRHASPLFTRTTSRPRSRSPSPIQLIGGARQDAYQGFARLLSEDEQYLFDFYLNYVILYGYEACYHKEEKSAFQNSMREVWVPWAMGQPSLMAAIFHVACRNYAANTSNSNSKKFSIKKLQYRLMCLNMAKDAIASQAVATDTTIALALIMASESFFEGDIDAFFTHGTGIIKMVTARGGLETLGLSGFLTKSVGWSIYSPKNFLVLGPDEAGLES